ncbi:MAG: glycine cleavage system protein H [Candidatus Nezhaarchaeales archaeon]
MKSLREGEQPNLLYSENHVWVRVQNHTIVLGITDFMQKQLGNVIRVLFLNEGLIEKGSPLALLESVKMFVAVLSPINCEVIKVNARLEIEPTLINKEPYGEGWIAIVKPLDEDQLRSLKDFEIYQQFISTLSRY